MKNRRAKRRLQRMNKSIQVVECSIETLDRTLYASREVGDLVDTGDFILSTALHHAFGFVSGKYINFGNKPSYVEETSEIFKRFYITPAKPESISEYMRKILRVQRPAGGPEPLPYLGGHSTSQWNARPHQYAVKNWKAAELPKDMKGKNLPKFGKERVLDQQNLLTAFILPYDIEAPSLAAEIPRYIRLGKKRSKARVSTRIIEGIVNEGEFLTNHPFGIYDYDGTPLGDLISIRMRPVPLIIQGRYQGKFVRIPLGGKKDDVVLPYKLEFLKAKR
jgi:CRISPR-associated protein Csc1